MAHKHILFNRHKLLFIYWNPFEALLFLSPRSARFIIIGVRDFSSDIRKWLRFWYTREMIALTDAILHPFRSWSTLLRTTMYLLAFVFSTVRRFVWCVFYFSFRSSFALSGTDSLVLSFVVIFNLDILFVLFPSHVCSSLFDISLCTLPAFF